MGLHTKSFGYSWTDWAWLWAVTPADQHSHVGAMIIKTCFEDITDLIFILEPLSSRTKSGFKVLIDLSW